MKISSFKQYSIPISIVVAGLLIAGAVSFSSFDGSDKENSNGNNKFGNNLSITANNVNPVENNIDHIRGDINAEVTIIEYSDYECPFCQRIHNTLTQILTEFDGQVRWVYRHFPLTSIHSKAFSASVASECIARLGGNDAFWNFTDSVFANQSSLSESLYENIVTDIGIPIDAFKLCTQDKAISEIVRNQTQNAIDSGGRGTPYIIVTNAKGDTFPFSGALPYEQIRSIIQSAIES